MASEILKYARYIDSSHTYQLLEDHLCSVAEISEYFAKKSSYQEFGYLSGLLHDLGKYSCSWQSYLQKSVKTKGLIEKEDHATAGAQYVNSVFSKYCTYDDPKENALFQASLELLEMIIMYHHGQGLPDMVCPDGTSPFLLRLGKSHDDTCIETMLVIISSMSFLSHPARVRELKLPLIGYFWFYLQKKTGPERTCNVSSEIYLLNHCSYSKSSSVCAACTCICCSYSKGIITRFEGRAFRSVAGSYPCYNS